MNLSLLPVLPEIVVLVGASIILLVDLFLKDEQRYVSYWLTQFTLLIAACVTVRTIPVSIDVAHTMHNLVVVDLVADVLRFFSFVAVSLVLFYSRSYLTLRGLFRGETFVLILFALLGMQVLITANSFLTLYLGLELMSLSLYALVAMQRDEEAPAEAAMKYFVLGALASGFLLYGMSMIYGATGSLEIDKVTRGGAGRHREQGAADSSASCSWSRPSRSSWAPCRITCGCPTCTRARRRAITLLIGTAPEFAAFAMMLRLLGGALVGAEVDWQGMLVVLTVLSVALGHIVAIAQTNLKRMLAYSTIANMGYVLMGFLAADVTGYSAAMFYMVAYVLTSLASFGMILLLSRKGFEADQLADLKGLNARSPWWAFVMLLVMFSLAGPAADHRLLREAAGAAGGDQGGLRVAGRGGRDRRADRGVLLPAHRQAHVLRRAVRHGRPSRRAATPACCCRPTASRCCCSASCRSR